MLSQIWVRVLVLFVIIVITLLAIRFEGIAMAHDNEIVNANILTRVLHLKIGDTTGTAFTIEVDGKQYLVTAKHMTGEKEINEIEIWVKHWQKIKVNVVGIGKGRADIIVLAADEALTRAFPVEVGSGGITIGQNVRFLGFPLGLSQDLMEMKLPLVKGGILSGMKFDNKVSSLFVDGHNNRGFSGGPVVFKSLDSGQRGVWKIAGIVSGYQIEGAFVRDKTGQIIGNAEGNSGILVATGIEVALKLIDLNPIGFPVAEN